MNPGKLVVGTAAILAFCLAIPARAQIAGFGATGTNWTLNTNQASQSAPTIANNVLQLVSSASAANSAFYDTPQYIGSFTASFVFQNNAANDGEGFVFAMQNEGTNAVGAVGDNYLGFYGITPAAGIAFDISSQGVAGPGLGYAPTQVPGGGTGGYIPTGTVNFRGTNAIAVSLSYANLQTTVTVRDTVTGATFSTNIFGNLTADAGGSTAYVGFTGGGTALLGLTISNFVFTPGSQNVTTSTYPVKLTNPAGTIDVTQLTGNESDGVIAYNPLNPAQMFIAANTNGEAGLFGSVSANSGYSWTRVSLANLPVGAYPAVAWDGYGNLFLAYVDGPFSSGYGGTGGIDVAVSTNGGTNFNLVTNLATGDFVELPRIAVGTGPALGSVWVLYKDFNLARTPLVAQGAAVAQTNALGSGVMGTNAVGVFEAMEIVPGTTNDCGFGDIVVGPQGQVMVAYQNLFDLSGAATCYVSVDPDGLGPKPFNPPVTATLNAIGGNTVIPASPDGQGINAAAGLAWDTNPNSGQYGRVYLVNVGQGPGGGSDTDIFLSSSTDNGQAWSAQKQVTDTSDTNPKFLPRLAVDPTDGILALSWYDCRIRVTGIVTNITGATTTIKTNDPGDNPPTNFSTNSTPTYSYTTNYSPPNHAVIFGTVSLDGGKTFQANVEITSPTVWTNGYYAPYAVSPTDFGDYTGLTFYQGTLYPVWADNSGSAYIYPTGIVNPDGPNGYFDISVAPVVLTGLANVSITSVVTTTNMLGIGSEIIYLLTASNAGPSAVTAAVVTNVFSPDVSVVIAFATNGTTRQSYSLNGNTLTWAVGALAANSIATIEIVTTAVGIGIATNFAGISPGKGAIDLLTNNTTTTLTNTIHGADLALSVTASPAVFGFGQLPGASYTVTVSNQGPVSASGVLISNVLSANLVLTGVTVGAGETYTTNASQNSVMVNVGSMTNGQVVTVGLTAYAPLPPPFPGFGPAFCRSVAEGIIDLTVTNNVGAATNQIVPPNLVIGMTGGPAEVTVGGLVTYTIGVTNLGPVPAFEVAITNFLPPTLHLVSVGVRKGSYTAAPDATISGQTDIIATLNEPLLPGQNSLVVITATAVAIGQTPNRAVVGDAVPDTNTVHNSAQAVVPVVPPDMALAMTGAPSSITAGQTVTYTLTVNNLGPVAATGVAVTNTLPANLAFDGVSLPLGTSYSASQNSVVFNLGSMSVGQTATVSVSATALSAGQATNSAIVGDSLADTNPGNNSASVVTTVIAASAALANLTVVPGVTGVFITWSTPFPSTSQVDYGLTTASNVSYLNPSPATNHVVMLTGLVPDTNYVFQARSISAAVPASGITNGAVVTISDGVPATLYTSNGTFSTTSSLILGTMDASYSGAVWTIGSSVTGIFGPNYAFTPGVGGNATASASYFPNIAVPGLYDLSIWYPVESATYPFSSATPMLATGTTNAVPLTANQSINGGGWQPVVTGLYFAAGTGGNLTLNNNTGDTSRSVVANGARWDYDVSQDNPAGGTTVPAWWASFYGLTNVSGTNSAFANGYTYYDEYVLGTNPTNSSSQLQFLIATNSPANVTVAFSPWQGGRVYQLQSSTNLGLAWVTLTNAPALNTSNGTGSFTVSKPPGGAVFYRLAASLSPTQ
jgi:uncharacterized repeat protein (TIGR01451 family)